MPDANTTPPIVAREDAQREAMEPIHELDKLRTLHQAADMAGLKYHIIQRATRRGLLKTYSLGTSKKYVTLRDSFDVAARSAEEHRGNSQ
jgi:hypothetical protein